MQLPDEAPKLPKLPFFVGDVVLLVTAALLAQRSEAPLSGAVLLAIVACVAFGAVLAVIPFMVEYARRQEAAVTDRQNSLEALARTTSAAAEQISIAAAGLHTITELVHKNLKFAEQLPHKLQEKINEFHHQRDEAVVAENEALTQEINSLRASEAEKLEAAAERIHRTVTELSKWESSAQTQLTALREAAERLPAAAEQAGRRAGQAVSSAGDDAVARLVAEIDLRVAAALGTLKAHAALSASPAPAALPAAEPTAPSPAATIPADSSPSPDHQPAERSQPSGSPSPSASEPTRAAAAPAVEDKPEPAPAPRKRPRKEAAAPVPTLPGLLDLPEPSPEAPPAPTRAVAVDEEPSAPQATGEVERSLSSDGVTRLVVTAYIGIGNRLYVRGEGPGLSWDKGVALQFVSIGKWRWENSDAATPVTVRIFKNDQIECPNLGAITIDPGQQAEVSAAF